MQVTKNPQQLRATAVRQPLRRPAPGPAAPQALIIEDEQDIASLIALHLRDLGMDAVACSDGRAGLARALDSCWRLIVLDLCLPNLDGLQICREVRDAGRHTPILILSARGSEQERILGLDSGADDYLGKPFGVLELLARVRAILRRVAAQPPAASVIKAGELEIDLERRLAQLGRVPLALTAREFDLLAHLASHPGKVFSRARLLDEVWGLTRDAYEHTVSSHINRLRSKVEPDPANPRFLLTSWGVGYRFVEY